MNVIERAVELVSEALGLEEAPPAPGTIAAKLLSARAEVAKAEKALAPLALAVEENEPGAFKRYEQAQGEHEAALARLRDVERAVQASRSREARQRVAAESDAQRKNEAEIRAALRRLHQAGEAYDEGLAKLGTETLGEYIAARDNLMRLTPRYNGMLSDAEVWMKPCTRWTLRGAGIERPEDQMLFPHSEEDRSRQRQPANSKIVHYLPKEDQ